MKSIIKASLLITFALIYGCKQAEIEPKVNPTNELSLQIEKTNSNDNFVSNTDSLSIKSKSAGWKLDSDGKVQLTREIKFDLQLENGKMVEFGLWFIKYETDQNLLILKDKDLHFWERNWDYISSDTEIKNFYYGFDEARVSINSNVIFHKQINDSFKIVSVEKVIVNGEEKSYVTISFNGDAFGVYDPNGEYMEVYKLSNGIFKGIIE